MVNSREKKIAEAIAKYGPITDRFILRLGKSEEEAGKFESWHSGPTTIEEDFQGFLACLRLTRLVDSVEERMKGQKSTIRAVKKEQRATVKALAKEQEKLQKALDKAAAKLVKEAEKARIKAEAKATRDALKAAKKTGGAPCTSTKEALTEKPLMLDTTVPTPIVIGKTDSLSNSTLSALSQSVKLQETPQLAVTISTVEKEKPSVKYEEEIAAPVFKLPME